MKKKVSIVQNKGPQGNKVPPRKTSKVPSQFSSCYSQIHWTTVKRVLRYLKETTDYELTFRMDNSRMKAFASADCGSCILDWRHMHRICFCTEPDSHILGVL
ncbi:hypothetical protein KM043_000081 [Ampulex compressa]|nr:hypothetical protein KM043_000081 [Ampulex compressa]